MSGGALMTVQDIHTATLLPDSLTSTPDVLAWLAAHDVTWQQLAAALSQIVLWTSLATQPSAVIDELAYRLHVEFYDPTMPLATRMAQVEGSIRQHMLAGTRGAVQDLITMIWGGTATIYEWWQTTPQMTPGVFLIELSGALAEVDMEKFLASINVVKRATDTVMFGNPTTPTTSLALNVGAANFQIDTYATFTV